MHGCLRGGLSQLVSADLGLHSCCLFSQFKNIKLVITGYKHVQSSSLRQGLIVWKCCICASGTHEQIYAMALTPKTCIWTANIKQILCYFVYVPLWVECPWTSLILYCSSRHLSLSFSTLLKNSQHLGRAPFPQPPISAQPAPIKGRGI